MPSPITTIVMKDFTFKLAYTEIILTYNININITLTDFIENIKSAVLNDLHMENIEIVPTGQDYVPGRAAEDADALLPSSQYTLAEYFREKIYFTSFYIRQINNGNQYLDTNMDVDMDISELEQHSALN
jgi:hypothetical protein